MLSSHYPLAFATKWNWAIASLIFLEGALIRHWFNTRHAKKGNPHWTWGLAVVIVIVIAWLSSAGKPEDAAASIAPNGTHAFLTSPHFAAVKQVIDTRCTECHAETPGYAGMFEPPKDVRLDSDAGIAQHAEQIALEAGYSTAMPPRQCQRNHPCGARADRPMVPRGQGLVTHDPAGVTVLRGACSALSTCPRVSMTPRATAISRMARSWSGRTARSS